jgi:hypothetical protein
LNHQSPSFEKVDSFLLVVTLSTKSSFELLDSTIRVRFDLECPGAWQNIVFLAISWVWKKFPAIEFNSHGLPEFGLKGAMHCCIKGLIVIIILQCYSTCSKDTGI